MLVADYIASYLLDNEIKIAFGYPGGMITFLMDSIDRYEGFKTFSLYHEQAAAFAAAGYTQLSNKMSIAYATSGPGATNLITGIAHAYYESIPVLFITGQVNTQDSKGSMKIRQKGFQETDVVALTKPITKYSKYISSSSEIKDELDKAIFLAKSGRPGPVLLDIPIDIQRSNFDASSINPPLNNQSNTNYSEQLNLLFKLLGEAKKPIFLLGNGIHTSGTISEIHRLIKKIKIPVLTSMIAVDLIPSADPQNFGWIGSYGNRHSNMIISKSDLIITLGSRLDIRQTGSNKSEFAKNAKIFRFDIDGDELENKIHENEHSIEGNLVDFLDKLLSDLRVDEIRDHNNWFKECSFYKEKLLNYDDSLPNHIVRKISKITKEIEVITTDVGQNQVWVAQSFVVQSGQRILFTGGHAPMGYSVPAAIGAYYHCEKPVLAFVGDGGLQINIQELQFIYREKLPIKIIVLNNNSLGMIRHFQEMYLDNNFSQTVENHGYSAPDFAKVGNAYGIRSYRLESLDEIEDFKELLNDNQPILLDIMVGNTTFTYPKLDYKKPIYDQEPPLERDFLNSLLNYNPEEDND